jgi:signal transduction histidine kinase
MESRLARIVKTFTFRLALVYVGLFGLSVILLFAFIYTFAMSYLRGQISDTIRLQYTYLANDYRENGSEAVEQRLKEFVANDDESTGVYILVNSKYEKIAGNLNEWPEGAVQEEPFEKDGHWVRFYIEGPRSSAKGIEVRAVMIPLSKWRSLLVGQTMQSNEKIEQTIVQAFWASLLLTLIMAFIGAIVMTRSVMGRINVINRSVGTIMHGDLSARIPFTRGGDEFDDLSLSLNQMLDRIEYLLESLSQFANNIAHDLRSPLNRIINRLEAGIRTIDDGNPARKLLEKNIQEMQDLVGTFNSILKISELEAGTEIRQFELCDLHAIISDLAEFYEPYAADKQVLLEQDIRIPLLLMGEKNLLTQAFANLIDNAIKFTPEGGRVHIFSEESTSHISIFIADSGPGVPESYRGKVFEKFFRMEESRNTRGNGLGLSLVAAIARIHEATITLEDNEPGLRVCLTLPRTNR